MAMDQLSQLDEVLTVLRAHEADLKRKGIARVAIFGSVVRQQSHGDSDVDIMVELDPANIPSLFTYLGIARELETWIGRPVDLSVRDRLKKYIRPAAEAETVYAF